MSESASRMEVIKLWSSVFLEADLPDHGNYTRRLLALSESHREEGVFAIDDPAVDWLKGQIAHAVSAYVRRAGFARAPEWGARGRFAVQRQGEYRALANQAGGDLAGMYVVSWPRQPASTGGRDDSLPGFASFYDPRAAMNMNAIKRDPYHGYHQSLLPRSGLLMLWPAYVSYFLHPNLSETSAVRVAFDVQLHSEARSG